MMKTPMKTPLKTMRGVGLKGVVVVGMLGLSLVATPNGTEAQRVAIRAKAPTVRVNVRVGPRVPVLHVHRAPVRHQHSVRSKSLRCDLREDVRDRREDIRDWNEDIADRREDRRDARHDGGLRDRLEDVADRAEDRRDRAEDIRDAREDVWDATHRGCRR